MPFTRPSSNGPQVGLLSLQAAAYTAVAPYPLDVLGAETEGMIGFFINTQVLRAEIDGQQTFASLLQQVKRSALWAQAHQDLPFEQLVDALQPERNMSHSPLFQVLFNHQRALGDSVERVLEGLTVQRMDWQQHTAQFDLALDTEEQGEHLRASLTYARDVYDAATIERLGGHWLNLLRAVVSEPQQRIAELALLDSAEQQRLIEHWNPSVEAQAQGPNLHQRFEAQAALQPQALANIALKVMLMVNVASMIGVATTSFVAAIGAATLAIGRHCTA